MKKKIHNERLFSDIFSFRPKREKILATLAILLIFINILLLSHIIWYTPSTFDQQKKLPYPFLITIIFIQYIFMVNVKTPRISS